MRLTAGHVESAVFGGAVLGAGGGGWIPDGIERGRMALAEGPVDLVSPDAVGPDEMLVTAAMVGAPSPRDRFVQPADFVRAAQILVERAGIRIGGFITNENGAGGTINGWLQAAALGVPVVDAPCNGRAHPTGVMGAMGLHRIAGYTSKQAAVGGNPAGGRYLEVYATGALRRTAAMTRAASVEAGGLVAVARDPVEASYVRAHGAPGAITMAIDVGRRLLAVRDQGGAAAAQAVADHLGGQVLDAGPVESARLEVSGGYDVGTVAMRGRRARYELTFWNEYMTLEADGERVATFPDLIATLGAGDGTPLPTAEMAAGMDVILLAVPRGRLILGAGMRDPELFRDVERAIGKEVVLYVFQPDDGTGA
jgi:DUF917 family protein